MGGAFVVNFIRFVLIALEILVLARVLLSWFDPGGRNAISQFVIQTSEPLLAPIRRVLPRTGMFDLSPLVVLLVIGVLLRAVG
ncbi:MAG TPA: YggT family protein [Candidatus Binatia bacterium]|nr:YggT family protein [Candidatus Binatia bacterium]